MPSTSGWCQRAERFICKPGLQFHFLLSGQREVLMKPLLWVEEMVERQELIHWNVSQFPCAAQIFSGLVSYTASSFNNGMMPPPNFMTW